MRDQLRLHKDKAAAYLEKGRYKSAISQYRSALQIAPDDVAIRQKLAELLTRLGDHSAAIAEYQHVAGRYAADGFLLKAMAICKVILQLDPHHTETQATLARLYAAHHGVGGAPQVLPASMSGALRDPRKPMIQRGALTVLPAREERDPSALAAPSSPPMSTRSTLAAATAAPTPPPSVTRAVPPPLPAATPPPLPAEAVRALPPDEETSDTEDFSPSQLDEDPFLPEDQEDAEDTESHDSLDLIGLQLAGQGAALEHQNVEQTGEVEASVDLDLLRASDEDAISAQFERATATPVSMPRIPPIPLFSRLDPEAFVTVFEHLELRMVPRGEKLITEGSRGSAMFVIVQGQVEVFREPGVAGREERMVVAEMGDGAFFGEMALLADAPRMASVVTTTECALLVMERDTLNHVATLHPSVAEVTLAFYRERLLQNLLRSNPLFEPFTEDEKQAIMDGFQSASVDDGVILLEKGQTGDGLYLLLRGTCQVVDVRPDGKVIHYPELKEGDVFGEISLLLGSPVSATVRTRGACLILRLDRDTFYERVMQNAEVRRRITQLTNERLRRTAELMSDINLSASSLV